MLRRSRTVWSTQNQKKFFDSLEKKLSIEHKEGWYDVGVKLVIKNGGGGLIKRYRHSLYEALCNVYPEYKWEPHRFPRHPHNHLKSVKSQREYLLEVIAPKLDISSVEDFANTKLESIKRVGGSSIVNKYKNNQHTLLSTIFPEVDWKNIMIAPKGGWSEIPNQRILFEKIAIKLGIQKWDDWYNISLKDLKNLKHRGVSSVLSEYSNSLTATLKAIYPEYQWNTGKFKMRRPNHWKNINNLPDVLKQIIKTYHIRKQTDFYRISNSQLKELRANGLYYQGGLYYMLTMLCPEIKWEKQMFATKMKKSAQFQIFHQLQHLFPQYLVYENYLFPKVIRKTSSCPLEIDIFVPNIMTAFEYQGEHHYYENPRMFGSIEITEYKDEEKAQILSTKSISLIPIPFWCKPAMLEAYLQSLVQTRPEISPSSRFKSPPAISESLHNHNLQHTEHRHHHRTINTNKMESKFMIPRNWKSTDDPKGFWISKKRSGLRVIWDGSSLYTTNGQIVHLPTSFSSFLSSFRSVEGMICSNEKNIVRAKKNGFSDSELPTLCFFLLDIPDSTLPFEERIASLSSQFSALSSPPAEIVLEQFNLCSGYEDLNSQLETFVKEGGDGLLLHKPLGVYEPGLSSNVLQLKYLHDCEVKLIGKATTLNTLLTVLPGNKKTLIRCSSENYMNPPPPGSVLTVGYFGRWESGKLRYPFLLRLCDMTWSEVLLFHQYGSKV